MRRTDLGVYLAIISARRPHNVERIQHLVGTATWYVTQGEAPSYVAHGATSVRESGALCASRNAALRDAWAEHLPCVQLSDDLLSLKRMQYTKGKHLPIFCSFVQAVDTVMVEMQALDARLGGVASNDNPLNFNPKRPVSTSNFVVGDFLVVMPCSLFFDEAFTLKEDYDYTMQHLTRYGIVVRCNGVLAEFQHYTNAGGAVAVRTPEREGVNIARLKKKWGRYIVDNTKRQNEVLLKWEKPAVSRSRAGRSHAPVSTQAPQEATQAYSTQALQPAHESATSEEGSI